MKNRMTAFGLIFGLVGLLSSCCHPCKDPALVKPASTGCNTQIQWQYSQAVQHSDGTMTSSISIVTDPSIPINTQLTDSTRTTVYVVATDTVCGIKCIELKGGFGMTCTMEGGTGIAIDGKLPDQRECSPLTTCALKSMRLHASDLENYLRNCHPPREFAGGGIGFTVVVENTAGQKDTSFLTVQFE
ncbi:MAG TPA: hypothetical protein VFX48_03875 [Saprospiraceae bacterium]|nr:hypothetical protein [Saprospiraceae bacterium]